MGVQRNRVQLSVSVTEAGIEVPSGDFQHALEHLFIAR
jgi:hypothetical protein